MLLYLIRHAQSQRNAGVPGAPVDCSLTELGQRQATAVAQRLAELGVDYVVASPYVRALETADFICRATGAPASVVPLLREHHVDPWVEVDWPFLSRTALAERFPEFRLPTSFGFDPEWFDVPETDEDVLRRARNVLRELWETYAASADGDKDVSLAVVSHGSPTGKLVLAALGLPSPQDSAVRIDNASISIVEYFPELCVLVASNRIDHLAHLGVNLAKEDPGYPIPR